MTVTSNPEDAGTVTGSGLHSLYDTMQPIKFKEGRNGKRIYEFERGYDRIKGKEHFTFENPESYKKDSPVELLGNMFGISTRYNYPKRGGKNQIIKNLRSKRSVYKNIEENR